MEAPTSLSKSDDQSRQRDGTTWLPLDDGLLRLGVGLVLTQLRISHGLGWLLRVTTE